MEEILNVIRDNTDFVIAGHKSPDGDAIGSSLALALALDKIGKNVRVLLEPHAKKYFIIPGREFLYSGELEDLHPQVFFALDCADIERLGETVVLFEKAETTVCVDHHETNSGFAKHNLIEPEASSTCEMVFGLIDKFTEPTVEIAAAVYAGMVSDTGGFRYNATATSTMKTAARLMDMGIEFTNIYNELMHQHGFSGLKAMGLAMEKSERTYNKKIVYTYMTREMLKSVNGDPSDLDGIVEYLMGTRKAKVAAFLYEKSCENVKVSLRSQGPNVGRVATKLGGGGHVLAAGATVEGTIPEVMKRVLNLLKREVSLYDKNGGDADSIAHEPPTGSFPRDIKTGIINVNKEKGYTSHDVVCVVRKILREKTGHTGTLDPNAEGVLPVCVGRATKLAEYFSAADKTYIAEIVLGITTDTGDLTGTILSEQKADVGFEELKACAESFVGEYMQTPPMYSAVKIGGKKLYELARKGMEIERPARAVKIHELRVFSDDGKYFIEVTCSKGTYIRSLCMDIGAALGCGAVMGDLTRTRSGIFRIEDSVKLSDIKPESLIPVEKVLPFADVYVKPEELSRALNGNPLKFEMVECFDRLKDEKFWLRKPDGGVIGLYTIKDERLRAEVML